MKSMKTKLRIAGWIVLLALSMFNLQLSTAHAQGTAFTYQGQADQRRESGQRQL